MQFDTVLSLIKNIASKIEGPQKGGSRQVHVVSHAAKENRINVYIQKKQNGYILWVLYT